MKISFRLNGRSVNKDLLPYQSSVDVLRDEFDCRSLHPFCRRGACGSCLVLIDSRPCFSCIRPVCDLQDRDVLTMEGMAGQDGFNDVLEGFREASAWLCDYCAPSRCLLTESLLRVTLHPSREQLMEVVNSFSCDCTAASRVLKAMKNAARIREGRLTLTHRNKSFRKSGQST